MYIQIIEFDFWVPYEKNMRNQNKFVGNSQSFKFAPASSTKFRRCLCVAIFIILESQSEKLWHRNYKLRHQNYKLRHQNYKLRHQNYKLRHQNFKLRPQNYKLRPQNYELRVQNLQV